MLRVSEKRTYGIKSDKRVVPDVGVVRDSLRVGSEEGAKGGKVGLVVCERENRKLGQRLFSQGDFDEEKELTSTGKADQDEVPPSSSSHRDERLTRKLMPLKHLNLPALLPIPTLNAILLITPKHTKINLSLHFGVIFRLNPSHRGKVVKLERRAKVDGLDHDVFPS